MQLSSWFVHCLIFDSKKVVLTLSQIHGFPDLSMGWRYQIPALLKLGLRVVVPDCLGYGRTVYLLAFITDPRRKRSDHKWMARMLRNSLKKPLQDTASSNSAPM